jgi:DNA-binding SARP family transcriptional activator
VTQESEFGSALTLLERGILHIRQGEYAAGITFITLVRERLSPDQGDFAARLDALLQSHEDYMRSVQALQLASKGFVEAESEQEAQIGLLEKLLSTLCQDLNTNPVDEPTAGPTERPAKQKVPPTDIANGKPEVHLQQSSPEEGTAFVANGKPKVHLQQSSPEEGTALPALSLRCFGCFEVKRDDQPLTLCHNRCGQGILRYLVIQSGYRASRDMLMEAFWRDDEPSVVRHKLEVAVSALRRSLNRGYVCSTGGGYVICKGQVYQLNPAVTIQSDMYDFLSYWQAGQRSSGSERVAFYEKACALRNGPFLVEDMYENWSFVRREQLNEAYLSMCHTLADYYLQTREYEKAVKWANARLAEDRCDEIAHRQLMYIYMAEGRRSEAIQQYQRCERALKEEGMQPMRETTQLFHALLAGEPLSMDQK